LISAAKRSDIATYGALVLYTLIHLILSTMLLYTNMSALAVEESQVFPI